MEETNFLKKIEPYLPVPLILGFLTVYFLCNLKLGVYNHDDILYATNLVTGEKLYTIGDVAQSQIWHYFNWGGRSVAHTILQLLFLCGDRFIDLFNPLVVMAFAAVCNLYAKKRSLWTLLAFLSGIYALHPIWYETQLWQTGIANYMYLSVIYLPVLYLYIKEAEEKAGQSQANLRQGRNSKKDAWMIPVMAVLGLLSGWSNENIGPSIFLGMLVCIIVLHIKKQKCPAWMYVGAVMAFLGVVFMVLAPGNYVRSDQAGAEMDLTGIKIVANRLYMQLFACFVYLSHILPFFLGSLAVYTGICRRKLRIGDLVLMLVAIGSVGAMVMSPHFPNRAIYGTTVILLCLSFRLLTGCRKNISPVLGRTGILILWAAGIFRMLLYFFE